MTFRPNPSGAVILTLYFVGGGYAKYTFDPKACGYNDDAHMIESLQNLRPLEPCEQSLRTDSGFVRFNTKAVVSLTVWKDV